MLCLDNSEHMRNGDYAPSRFEAQTQAAHYLAGAKSQVKRERSSREDLLVAGCGAGIEIIFVLLCWEFQPRTLCVLLLPVYITFWRTHVCWYLKKITLFCASPPPSGFCCSFAWRSPIPRAL